LSLLQQFYEAIAVQDHLLQEGLVDVTGAAVLRMGRAMAMLREDRLFDADRAINELRRGPAAGSAGVTLIAIYRDVQPGHPGEAGVIRGASAAHAVAVLHPAAAGSGRHGNPSTRGRCP